LGQNVGSLPGATIIGLAFFFKSEFDTGLPDGQKAEFIASADTQFPAEGFDRDPQGRVVFAKRQERTEGQQVLAHAFSRPSNLAI
jgi:hypothetical protein